MSRREHNRAYRFVRASFTIISAVLRYGWLLLRERLPPRLHPTPAHWQRAHARTGQQILELASSLGGAFVKVGQIIGARADAFPEALIAPLRALHDRMPPRPLAELRDYVREELGGVALETVFEHVEPDAMAAASLAQVHGARLLDGTEVVLKIQYPEARRLFPGDLASLKRAVAMVRLLAPRFDLTGLADELARYIVLELEFTREAASTERARVAFAQRADVHVPRVYKNLSSDRLLVLERRPGVAISQVAALRRAGIDLRALAMRVADVYCEMIFAHGFFHGDPHPGNILVDDSGEISLIDFGLAKELPAGFALGVARMIVAGLGGDGAGALDAARAIGFRVERGDPQQFLRLVQMMFGGFGGPEALIGVLEASDIDEVPPDLTLILRVFILLNGLSQTLAPNERLIPTAIGRALMPLLAAAGRAPGLGADSGAGGRAALPAPGSRSGPALSA
ncbi:MAG: AarF/ABC1/UbiB kinase family protein [Myxococcales bacterium]|nr:AarF/ABC1/UbiB kinase family protein [Myxococcales bacterium]